MKRAASTTLYIHPASHSPLALVIRRGPSKWWHFLLWDRDSGIITPGSWFNGMIYPHRCDLSPRGDWMIILAFMGANNPPAWTALCRPPSVKAVCFFPQRGMNHGGGFFDARQPVVWLNSPEGITRQDFCRHGFEFGYQEENQQPYGSFHERLERDGWKHPGAKKHPRESAGLPWVKKSPTKDYELLLEIDPDLHDADLDEKTSAGEGVRYGVRPVSTEGHGTPIEDVSWANWNRRGELCLASGGSLFIASPKAPNDKRRLVVDLEKLTPRIKKERVAETTK